MLETMNYATLVSQRTIQTNNGKPSPPGVHVLSILEAVFIVSPKMENLGSLLPMRPL